MVNNLLTLFQKWTLYLDVSDSMPHMHPIFFLLIQCKASEETERNVMRMVSYNLSALFFKSNHDKNDESNIHTTAKNQRYSLKTLKSSNNQLQLVWKRNKLSNDL